MPFVSCTNPFIRELFINETFVYQASISASRSAEGNRDKGRNSNKVAGGAVDASRVPSVHRASSQDVQPGTGTHDYTRQG